MKARLNINAQIAARLRILCDTHPDTWTRVRRRGKGISIERGVQGEYHSTRNSGARGGGGDCDWTVRPHAPPPLGKPARAIRARIQTGRGSVWGSSQSRDGTRRAREARP